MILKVKGSDSETLPNLMLWGGGNLMITDGSWLSIQSYIGLHISLIVIDLLFPHLCIPQCNVVVM